MKKSQLKQLIKEAVQHINGADVGRTTPEFAVRDKVTMGDMTLTITKIETFSGTNHYGILGETKKGGLFNGWVPVILLNVFGRKVTT
jgi:hypothetical protein